ncbi:MAG: hypothetical protein M1824_005064 [Vezdaea acicularis]|nr:MAG: hypothetical protein M1824_005064 [Vezdaea acicularis]
MADDYLHRDVALAGVYNPQYTPNMQRQQPDELSILFNRSLTITPTATPPHSSSPFQQPPQPAAHAPVQYSITQHYHHSAHLASPPPGTSTFPSSLPLPAASSSDLQTQPTDAATTSIILARNGVDAGLLSQAQLSLFRHSGLEVQMRLVEIWRVSPPDPGSSGVRTSLIDDFELETSLALEEQSAQERMERRSWEASRGWREYCPKDVESTLAPHAEPYIVNGYAQNLQTERPNQYQPVGKAIPHHNHSNVDPGNNWAHEYNRATDPVYSEKDRLATQYGAFEARRAMTGSGENEDEEMA